MRFRLKSLLMFVAAIAVVLAIFVYIREQQRAADEKSWTGLQSNGVLFLASRNDASELQNAEIWVSTIDDQTYEVNGERLSEFEARNKLILLHRHLNQLGIRWYVFLDSEPGTVQTRQSTFDLVYSAGFTSYDDLAGQGTSTYDERRSEGEARKRLYKPNIDRPESGG